MVLDDPMKHPTFTLGGRSTEHHSHAIRVWNLVKHNATPIDTNQTARNRTEHACTLRAPRICASQGKNYAFRKVKVGTLNPDATSSGANALDQRRKS